MVFTGDNVYYDKGMTARTRKAMRTKWHRVFSQPRMVDFLAVTPAYFQKDDHDYRFNDCDNTGLKPPSPRLGHDTFLEQVPAPGVSSGELPYRTHRVTKELQIWLVEGRDFRSPNRSPDGPDKTLWGLEQRAWLMRTLKESDAAIKLLISPTPLVGPDDAYKKDNHVGGFRYERDLFFEWAKSEGLERGLHFICGDRHWQYHSIHPLGFEEFSVGTLVDANARMGRDPGDPKGTDPEAEIKQLHTSPEPSGGFLLVTVEPGEGGASAVFELRDEQGALRYQVERGGRRE